MHEERSPVARARAETALVRLVHELGDETDLIVLGGLVPALIVSDPAEPGGKHLGTTDVDVLLLTQVDPDRDRGSVEAALRRLRFRAVPDEDGWRWTGEVDGSPVTIEFLCDLPSEREGEAIRPVGCTELSAANLRGTGYVERDSEWRQLTGGLADGSKVSVRVRFAGLEGYLLSKCVAVRTRAATKDYYDLAYVLLHNAAGGPEPAAAMLRTGPLADALPALQSTFVEVRERYLRTTDIGPRGYADQGVLADPTADAALLRADAVDAVQRFIDELRI